jgi:hypothetical protein
MRIDVLGPLRVTHGGAALGIGGQSAIALAWLALRVGRPVRLADLARVLGAGTGPDAIDRARAVARRLASGLPAGTVVRDIGSVRLVLPEDAVDAERFRGLAADARRHLLAGLHDRVRADVDAALALWRSSPYPELAQNVLAAGDIERLEVVRAGVLEMQQEVAMHESVDFTTVAALRDLVVAYPERLGFRLLLARALHLMDRQADALDVLRRTSSEFGGHPAPRRLTDLIAHRDPRLASMSLLEEDHEIGPHA